MTIKVFLLRLLSLALQISQPSTGIQYRNRLVREIVLHYLVMQNAQVRIHKTISETHLVRVTKMVLRVRKLITYQNSIKVFLVPSNLTKTNKDFTQTAQVTIQLPTPTQIRAAKWAIQTKLPHQQSTHLIKVRSTIGWPFWSLHLNTKTVKSTTRVTSVAFRMKMLFKEDQLNPNLTNK